MTGPTPRQREVHEAVRRHGGNQSAAARELRIDRSTVSYLCQRLECGERFMVRDPADGPQYQMGSLDAHWRESGHGPRQVAADAIDRARFSLLGRDAPPPEDVYGSGHLPDHRR